MDTFITTRENVRQGKLDAGLKMAAQCHATDEAVAEAERLRHACYGGEARLADLLADHRDFCAKEESLKEQTRLEMVKLRDFRDQTVSALHTQAENNALIVKHSSEEKALADGRGDTLSESIRHSDEQLDQSRAQVERLEAEIYRRTVDKEQADSFAAEFTTTFEIARNVTGCIYIDRYDNLPENMQKMQKYIIDHTWAGDEFSGYNTGWLAPAFEKNLELRSR